MCVFGWIQGNEEKKDDIIWEVFLTIQWLWGKDYCRTLCNTFLNLFICNIKRKHAEDDDDNDDDNVYMKIILKAQHGSL